MVEPLGFNRQNLPVLEQNFGIVIHILKVFPETADSNATRIFLNKCNTPRQQASNGSAPMKFKRDSHAVLHCLP
jgi:hypothetical protein